jgi:thioesterase domain-containing protein
VYVLQNPTNVSFDHAEDLAAYYIDQVRAVQPTGPYHFAGHCSGGITAYVMACQLQAAGYGVSNVVLLDTPFLYSRLDHWLYRLVRAVARNYLAESPVGLRSVRRLWEMVKDDGLAAQLDAVCGYTPACYRDRVTLFVARRSVIRFSATRWRWQRAVGSELDIHLIPGDHDNFLRAPYIQDFARRLRACLMLPESLSPPERLTLSCVQTKNAAPYRMQRP